MILLVEMQCKDWEHNRVNTGFIQLLKSAFPREDITLCAEKKHIMQIRQILASENLAIEAAEIEFGDWRHKSENNSTNYATLINKIISGYQNVTDVFFLSCNKGIILGCSEVAQKRSNVNFRLILHAALEEVCRTKKKSLKARVKEVLSCIKHLRLPPKTAISMRACMEKCSLDNCSYIVYSPNYANGLQGKIRKDVIDKITFLHHPFYKSDLPHKCLNDRRVRVGIYGQAVNQNALEIIRTYNEKYDNGSVDFLVMAKKDHEILQQKNVSRLFVSDYVSNEELEEAISSFDYILIPYSQDQYIVTASGIFCDAVSQECPLLMLASPYLNYYAKYHIGIIEESIEAMAKDIAALVGSSINPKTYSLEEKRLKAEALQENIETIIQIMK